MFIAKSSFLVVGLALSGETATRELLRRGGKCVIYDDSNSPSVQKVKEELLMLGAIECGENIEEVISKVDVVVLSPGVPIDHNIPLTARKLNKRVIGELELGSLLINSPIVAVTGTNGKTTTSTMIYEILKNAGEDCYLLGNVGEPICGKVNMLGDNSIAVTEVSSFQLETVHLFCPHIAVVLNISPDHLSRHYNMDNYTYLKKRILRNMRESEYAVLNADDKIVSGFSQGMRCKTVYFSQVKKVDGAYIVDESVYYKGEYILPKSAVPFSGAHNVENMLASICVCKLLGVSNEIICSALTGFSGVKHRIEFVKEIDGVKFYNDSKATNPDATIKAINSMTVPTVVILGGKDKELNYDELFKNMLNSVVTCAVVMGENRYILLESAMRVGFNNIVVTPSFSSSVKVANLECEEGGAVLFSPATSSFDMFKSFEERGNAFIKIVQELDE